MGKIYLLLILIVVFIFPSFVSASDKVNTSAELKESRRISSSKISSDSNLKKLVIKEVLEKYKSPLLDEVDGFMDACTKHSIDCYLLPSISGLESSFGKFTYPESHNPFGWGGGYIMFDSWSDAFLAVAKGLKNNYIASGAESIEAIGPIYAESPTWAVRVRFFHNEFLRVEAEKKTAFSELARSK